MGALNGMRWRTNARETPEGRPRIGTDHSAHEQPLCSKRHRVGRFGPEYQTDPKIRVGRGRRDDENDAGGEAPYSEPMG